MMFRQKGIDVLASVISWLMQERLKSRHFAAWFMSCHEWKDAGNGVTGNVQLIMMGTVPKIFQVLTICEVAKIRS